MLDMKKIHSLIARARRRLRVQAALENAATFAVLSFAAGLIVVYAVRQGALGEQLGITLLIACLGVIALGGLIGALRRFPTHVVATRIDRASNLADRLSSACAFEEKLSGNRPPGDHADDNPETAAFMQAAIRDAIASVPRADVPKATPFRKPRDLSAAATFALVTALVAGLYWPDDSSAHTMPLAPQVLPDGTIGKPGQKPADEFVEDDLDYTRDMLEDLRRTAREDKEPNLQQFVDDVENLLQKAEQGELSKEQLLEELSKAEQRYMEGKDEDIEETMAELKKTGQELKKEPLTSEMGKALEKGDLEKAQQEMDKLAKKLENNELSEKDQQKVSKALEKAAEKFEQRQKKQEDKLNKDIDQKKEQIRRLKKKQEETKNEQQKRKLKRKLDKKKRELKRLEKKKQERQKSQQKRTLKSLHRNMKQAAKDLNKQKQKNQSQEQKQQQRRQASQRMRRASRDTGKVNADRRRIRTQKKVASQLSDLKEAMRRARRRGRNGMRDMFGKNRDFKRRARGKRGSRQAWRPGQGKGKGQGQGKGKQGQGKGKGGKNYGDGHDPYLMGDPTAKSGNTRDRSVSGAQGRSGQSVRETILSAAQKGFSSRQYKKVFTEYKDIVEEVIRAEKVPSGYKYYVKRYFNQIKPHSMD